MTNWFEKEIDEKNMISKWKKEYEGVKPWLQFFKLNMLQLFCLPPYSQRFSDSRWEAMNPDPLII